MKKITLALVLLSFGVQAQNFPSPYCDLDDTTVERITSVTFANSVITNSDTSNILIDKTATVVAVSQGQTYTIEVEGFTDGDFNNNIVAYIDWNQNDILNDAGEVYPVGTITNSTGSDGSFVTLDITVPADALLGTTRIRITKTYTDDESVAVVNPCAIEMDISGYGIFPGFGQALDFTLETSTLGIEKFDKRELSIYPIPSKGALNVKYNAVINAIKIYNLLGQEVLQQKTGKSQFQLDVSSLSAGAYILELSTDVGLHNERILKQ